MAGDQNNNEGPSGDADSPAPIHAVEKQPDQPDQQQRTHEQTLYTVRRATAILRLLACVSLAGAMLYITEYGGGGWDTQRQGGHEASTSDAIESPESFPASIPVTMRVRSLNVSREMSLSTTSTTTPNPMYERMILEGLVSEQDPYVNWRELEGGVWGLEVAPTVVTNLECPQGMVVDTRPLKVDESYGGCDLYEFKIIVINHLSQRTTLHWHGLAPPVGLDGVHLSATSLAVGEVQYYRFTQREHAGFHWIHSHYGFQAGTGLVVPLIFQHSDDQLARIGVDQDVVVVAEQSFMYPSCAYSGFFWYPECKEKVPNSSDWRLTAFMLNSREDPLVVSSAPGRRVRLRLLNAAAEAPWNITLKTQYGMSLGGAEVLAIDGNDIVRGEERGATGSEFVLGAAERLDLLVTLDPDEPCGWYVIQFTQMMHRGAVTMPAVRFVIIHTYDDNDDNVRCGSGEIAGQSGAAVAMQQASKLPKYLGVDATQPYWGRFDLLNHSFAAHPLPRRPANRTYYLVTLGGDQFGGFPMTLYDDAYAEVYPDVPLAKRKFQLPPFKLYAHRDNPSVTVSSRRACRDCEAFSEMNSSGIIEDRNPGHRREWCCWEWCDYEGAECDAFELVDMDVEDAYPSDPTPIPVSFGDRVSITMVNALSFEENEGHPMHLHGHKFEVVELFELSDKPLYDGYSDVSIKDLLASKSNATRFNEDGPLLDTVWIPWGYGVTVEFDAYNPGRWLLHCHNEFHMEGGMMTTVQYTFDEEGGEEEAAASYPTSAGGKVEFTSTAVTYPEYPCGMDGCGEGGGGGWDV